MKKIIIGGIFVAGAIGIFIANKFFNAEKNNFAKVKNTNEETPKEKKNTEESNNEKPEKGKDSKFSNINTDTKFVWSNDNQTISSSTADEIRNILANMKY